MPENSISSDAPTRPVRNSHPPIPRDVPLYVSETMRRTIDGLGHNPEEPAFHLWPPIEHTPSQNEQSASLDREDSPFSACAVLS